MADYEVGEPVSKVSGYKFDGYVVAVFKTRKGLTRYVIEHFAPQEGLLHIFNAEQLAPYRER